MRCYHNCSESSVTQATTKRWQGLTGAQGKPNTNQSNNLKQDRTSDFGNMKERSWTVPWAGTLLWRAESADICRRTSKRHLLELIYNRDREKLNKRAPEGLFLGSRPEYECGHLTFGHIQQRAAHRPGVLNTITAQKQTGGPPNTNLNNQWDRNQVEFSIFIVEFENFRWFLIVVNQTFSRHRGGELPTSNTITASISCPLHNNFSTSFTWTLSSAAYTSSAQSIGMNHREEARDCAYFASYCAAQNAANNSTFVDRRANRDMRETTAPSSVNKWNKWN